MHLLLLHDLIHYIIRSLLFSRCALCVSLFIHNHNEIITCHSRTNNITRCQACKLQVLNNYTVGNIIQLNLQYEHRNHQ